MFNQDVLFQQTNTGNEPDVQRVSLCLLNVS